jgi:hypothetical protein
MEISLTHDQAVGNFERMTFGKNFQTKLVPESKDCFLSEVL